MPIRRPPAAAVVAAVSVVLAGLLAPASGDVPDPTRSPAGATAAVPVATGPSGAAAPGADPAFGPGLDDA
ncbi:MAG TPA: hypothetical protein VLA97_07140, partial [Nocardioidaceae bacterium]|nr:hypothetical protein [Nocardioidaceae bacterium]